MRSRSTLAAPVIASLLLAGFLAHPGQARAQAQAQAQAQDTAPPPVLYHGTCAASAAAAISEGALDGLIAVANDVDNTLRLYRAGQAAPASTLDLDTHLGIAAADVGNRRARADIEATARLGERIYWIASHSRDSDGDHRPYRHRFFATRLQTGGQGGPTLQPEGRATSLTSALRAALEALLPPAELAKAFGAGEGRDPGASPDNGGLNIEGLSARPDGSLLIGLRGPLHEGNAIVIPLLNPAEVVGGQEPVTGPALAIALEGRGIRAIEYVPSREAYLIVAGPQKDGDDFALFTWSGIPDASPLRLGITSWAALDLFRPEGLVVGADGSRIHLFSDDEDMCKRHTDQPRQFRSIEITLSGP